MSVRRRLGLLVVGLPIAFYAYACSSESDPGAEDGADGGTEGSVNPGLDSSTRTDSSTGTDGSTVTDGGTDASDGAVTITCVGNPLTADGGTADGGANLDAAVVRELGITYPLVAGSSFLDGPQWIEADGGALVFSQLNSAPPQVLRVAIDGGAATALRSAPNGQLLLPVGNATRNGMVLTAVTPNVANQTPVIWQTAPDGGAGPSIAIGATTNPNDLVVGANGNIYFTDPQYQANPAGDTGVYRVLGDGGVQLVQKDLARPNGIALAPDGKKLYVGLGPLAGDPNAATAKGVLVYTVAADGAVTTPGAAFLTSAELVDVPDGIAVDVGGNVWVAEAAGNGDQSGRVEVFGPDKKKLGTLPFPTKRPTGVAFGGADNKTLFITAESGVFVYTSRCAGVR